MRSLEARRVRETGAGSRNRTRDLLITNQLLYQLSYAGKALRIIAQHTAQLSYAGTGKSIADRHAGPSYACAVMRME